MKLIERIKDRLEQYAYLGDEYVMELNASELKELLSLIPETPKVEKCDVDDLPENDEFYGGVESPW